MCLLRRQWAPLCRPVRQGKALYVGISFYSAKRTRKAARILKAESVKLLIHQPSYPGAEPLGEARSAGYVG